MRLRIPLHCAAQPRGLLAQLLRSSAGLTRTFGSATATNRPYSFGLGVSVPIFSGFGAQYDVLSRIQLAWRDFTADELAAGTASLDFAVPFEHSIESGNESRFEFRFFHLGNADLAITAVELDRELDQEADEGAPVVPPPAWRLLGRLQKSWLGRRLSESGDGCQKLRLACRRERRTGIPN